MQWKVERLALKTLGPQRKSFNALGTTRSTLFAEMFLGEKFVCIITAQPARIRPLASLPRDLGVKFFGGKYLLRQAARLPAEAESRYFSF